ncbi:GNAT family N-acetyltransferase [Kiloniella sp. EL199]|uniref:GNAT family N-acetyltransferase n=1 Tax=Kiloniella sp. EL199 TaxID=2107581 RepID=UPI000EA388E3|nr:GNAT family N-acetyltransferase [Kiloniella sp. EL199]
MSDIFVNCRIETDRMIIRSYAMEDATSLQGIASDPKVLEYLPDDPLSLKEVEDIITWSIGCHKRNSKEKLHKLNLAILLKETEQLIGWCGLGPADWDQSLIEIYYTLAPEHWGKGLATEAAITLRDYAFETIKLKKLVGIAATGNIASNKVLQKLGMKYEGRLETVPESCDPYFLGQNLYSLTPTKISS